jgi:hypothetical protein
MAFTNPGINAGVSDRTKKPGLQPRVIRVKNEN